MGNLNILQADVLLLCLVSKNNKQIFLLTETCANLYRFFCIRQGADIKVLLKFGFQKFSGIGFVTLSDVLRNTLTNDMTTIDTAFWSKIDYPVS